MEKTIEITVEAMVLVDGTIRIKFPKVAANSELGKIFSQNLNEIQPGFGQIGIEEAWAKIAHTPDPEMFGLDVFIK